MTTPKTRQLRRCSALLASLSAYAVFAAAPVQAESRHAVDIPAGALETALVTLANQTHQQVFFTPDVVSGRRAPALQGDFTAEQALARLLAGSGVKVHRTGPRMLVLTARADPAPTTAPAAAARPFGDDPGAGAAGTATPALTVQAAAPSVAPRVETTVAAVEVTGTHLRGVDAGASPIIALNRDDLERTGQATIAGALNTLPQVFSGMATEGTLSTSSDRSGSNPAFGTGVNLRGLGTDATLVLVNGRRMAGAGIRGDFADVSTLPTVAVERVDILLDGASALYGSDAVGGVVNVILRRDYEGAETRVLAGVATAGEPTELQIGQVFGRRWAGGSALVAYEFNRRDRLPGAARRYTATTDLRALGGTDHRLNAAHPGNIQRLDPVTQATVNGWAIPEGQNGTGLRPSDFIAGAVNLDNQRTDVDTIPEQTRHSAYLAVRQALSPSFELSADLRWGYRRYALDSGHALAILNVTRANPFFVSPNGSTSHQIAYGFLDDLPATQLSGSQESVGATLGADLQLFGDWRLEGYAALAQEIGHVRSRGSLNSALLNEALGTVADRPETAFSTARDGFFNPFAGIRGANNPTVLAFIGSGFSTSRNRGRLASANLQADGTLLQLPGGPLKAALGLSARREEFSRRGLGFTTTVTPTTSAPIDAHREVLAGFAELRAPLVDEAAERPGLRRLELSLAGRVERYDDFGTTTNPKAGVLWSPAEGVNLRATYGRSFRAPDLRETRDAEAYSTSQLNLGASRVVSLILSGGNPDLDPETATSWTAGVDISPPTIPGLKASLGWFQVRFKDRIAQPARTSLATVLTDPALAPFVERVTPATNAADRARIAALLANPVTSASAFPAEAYGAIVDTRYVNTATLEVRGIDVTLAYRTSWGDDRVGLSANASYLYDYVQQVTPTSTPFDTAGVVNFPLKFRGRATADWSRGPLGALVALNYAGAYHDSLGVRLRAQATFDAQLSLTGPTDSRWAGLRATLNARNLFDRAPPFYDSPLGVAYDPANADPIGRYVSLQITRAW